MSAYGSNHATDSEDESSSSSDSESLDDLEHSKDTPQHNSHGGVGIVVMGLTGTGKSSFISQLSQSGQTATSDLTPQDVEEVQVGHSLHSCTTSVKQYLFCQRNGERVWLIDTPGFDDTTKANGKVLREIASALCMFCHNPKSRIGGLIFLHRITDPRMSNSSLRSIRIFEELCGPRNFKGTAVVTTMWDNIKTDIGKEDAVQREKCLRTRVEFFGRLAQGGASLHRQEARGVNNHKVVEALLDRSISMDLLMLQELRRENSSTLRDTSVGVYLKGDLAQQKARYEAKIQELQSQRTQGSRHDKSGRQCQNSQAIPRTQEDDEDFMSEVQEQIQLIEENGEDTRYLNVTYDQLLVESSIGSQTINHSSEEELTESHVPEMSALRRFASHHQKQTEPRDSRPREPADRLKDEFKATDDRGELSREADKKTSRAAKDQKLFAKLFTAPFRKSASASSPQEKESAPRKSRSTSTPPESSPKTSRHRDTKGKRPKGGVDRSPPKQDVRLQVQSSPQLVDADNYSALSDPRDQEVSYFDHVHTSLGESDQSLEPPTIESAQVYINQRSIERDNDRYHVPGGYENVDFGSVSLPRTYEDGTKILYRWTPVGPDEHIDTQSQSGYELQRVFE